MIRQIMLDRKKVRKVCPHYKSGGWCHYMYNNANDFEKEHDIDFQPCTCIPEQCSTWLDEIVNKSFGANSNEA